MEEKELKIDTPLGYEIDREKSTFEKIIFKKVKNFRPKTWEEYHNLTKGKECCNIDDDDCVRLGYADEFSSKRRKDLKEVKSFNKICIFQILYLSLH